MVKLTFIKDVDKIKIPPTIKMSKSRLANKNSRIICKRLIILLINDKGD